MLPQLSRRSFLLSAAAAPLVAQPARRPNIVILLADDLGYGETGLNGPTDIPTPHIDSIAKNGVRFTDGYVSCPVCSPTRAGLMTGRYQQRFGHENNPGPAAEVGPEFGLPLDQPTIAERLRAAGYRTGMFGKWHLGYEPRFRPLARGFEEFYGFLGGAHSYVNAGERAANPIWRGEEKVSSITYLTDELARDAAAFVEKQRRDPFFLYVPFNAVHAPMDALEKYRARFATITDPRRRTFAAMLSALDDGVGQILGAIRQHKLEENTLVFFLSDNGGPTPQTTAKNNPLRGFKGQVYEGGTRVPFAVQWKGRIPAGKTYSNPVIALDLHATALAAAGLTAPAEQPLDGVDLLPYVTGKNAKRPHEQLYWRFGPQSAIRSGDWKLVRPPNGAPQLFDLAKDVGESTDLAAKEPERVRQLTEAYGAWNAQLSDPKWQRARPGRRR